MATLTIRIPDDKHSRLKALAQYRHVSINKLMDELSTQALAEFDLSGLWLAIYAILTIIDCKTALPFGVKSQINAAKFKITVTQKTILKGCFLDL